MPSIRTLTHPPPPGPDTSRFPNDGFTLLEVLIVIFILGLLAAMVLPAMGVLDDRTRRRITEERMDLIRRATLGPEDRFDARGRPVIGGYVGDMHAWPDLWEARAEIKPDFGGNGWETPTAMAAGLGQGPDYLISSAYVFFRPSGTFVQGAWQWLRPYRKLYDDPSGSDHIGGLATENEGQPRGLWTRYVEDLPFDLPGHSTPGAVLGANWKGPYLNPPRDRVNGDADHWAASDDDYAALEPFWHAGGYETWEEGDYAPVAVAGEYFDDKESFRLLQTEGRLADGWERALRFFISSDPDAAGDTIFWIISEGPDGEGTYPNKGACGGHVWSVDPDDTMGLAYDPGDAKNRDNIVLKLYSRDWRAVLAAQEAERAARTLEILDHLRAASAGRGPSGCNTGFSGDLARWPRLFRWEDNATPADPSDDHWDDRDDADVGYTKGQPRGLWSAAPNAADTSDDLRPSAWGIGWRHAYFLRPVGDGADQVIRDAWEREMLFFYDGAADRLLILSRGTDGMFAFGSVSADGSEPLDYTETLDVSTYDPTAAVNLDNLYIVLAPSDRLPGFLRIDRLVVLNAATGTTKCRFFATDSAPVAGVDLLTAAVLTDEDLDLTLDDWAAGDGTPADPAFNYDDTTPVTAATGARYLVCWQDTDADDEIDSGESHWPMLFNVTAESGSGQYGTLTLDTTQFRTVP